MLMDFSKAILEIGRDLHRQCSICVADQSYSTGVQPRQTQHWGMRQCELDLESYGPLGRDNAVCSKLKKRQHSIKLHKLLLSPNFETLMRRCRWQKMNAYWKNPQRRGPKETPLRGFVIFQMLLEVSGSVCHYFDFADISKEGQYDACSKLFRELFFATTYAWNLPTTRWYEKKCIYLWSPSLLLLLRTCWVWWSRIVARGEQSAFKKKAQDKMYNLLHTPNKSRAYRKGNSRYWHRENILGKSWKTVWEYINFVKRANTLTRQDWDMNVKIVCLSVCLEHNVPAGEQNLDIE